MQPDLIPSLVRSLQLRPVSPAVANPYTSSVCRQNITRYLHTLLSYPYSGHLLVGICPGEKGCAVSGIPFTDELTLRKGGHPFLDALGLTPLGDKREDAAQQVWKQAKQHSNVPAFWNVFPFHCQKSGRNRNPIASEVREGLNYLEQIIEILDPHTIVPVGAIPKKTTKPLAERRGLAFLPLPYPKYAGTNVFIDGYAGLFAGSL